MPAYEDSKHIPENISIYWDNVKTTAIFSAKLAFWVPVMAGAGIGFVAAVESGNPLPILSGSLAGVVAGAGCAPVAGLISGTLIAPFFYFSALYTRDFKTHDETDECFDIFSEDIEEGNKKLIIQDIIRADQERSWLRIQSHESYSLIQTLKQYQYNNANKAWDALTAYMTHKSDNGAYVHNGKKLFNTAIDSIKTIKGNKFYQVRQAVQEKNINEVDKFATQYNDFFSCKYFSGGNRNLLHYAAAKGHEEVVTHLLARYRSRLNLEEETAIFDDSRTALYLAVKGGHAKIVTALLDAGAKTDKPDIIHVAVEKGHFEIVKILVENNNDLISQLNGFCCKKSLLQTAEEYGHHEITSYLTEQIAASRDGLAKMKNELKQLATILSSPLWKTQGWGIFCNHTPDRIAKLRDYVVIEKNLNLNDEIDKLSAISVVKEVEKLKEIVRSGDYASGKQRILYNLVKNLGQNDDADFNQLNDFNHEIKGSDFGYSLLQL